MPRGASAQPGRESAQATGQACPPWGNGGISFLGPDAIKISNSITPLFCSHTHEQPSSNLAPRELVGQVHAMMDSSVRSIAPYKSVNRCSDFISTS